MKIIAEFRQTEKGYILNFEHGCRFLSTYQLHGWLVNNDYHMNQLTNQIIAAV